MCDIGVGVIDRRAPACLRYAKSGKIEVFPVSGCWCVFSRSHVFSHGGN